MLDASTASTALLRKDAVGTAVGRLIEASTCHAPHLIDAEVGNVLRRHEREGLIDPDTATIGLRMLATMVDRRYATRDGSASRTGCSVTRSPSTTASTPRWRHDSMFHCSQRRAAQQNTRIAVPGRSHRLSSGVSRRCRNA
ncbi:type II toxin-antitoxin system VapC family toxin [Nocardia canadensis]|uniref:type II toxin-antitoxin system VapC family toxin n=1 Tax=Nocardia canadensis TaxID=3065238 RepID=UPI0029301A77|nr:type II toxin-antitoxin system VapC family toxin [Nocardia canadensis]